MVEMEGFDARTASGTGYPQTLARLCEKETCIGGRELSICDAPRRKYEGLASENSPVDCFHKRCHSKQGVRGGWHDARHGRLCDGDRDESESDRRAGIRRAP